MPHTPGPWECSGPEVLQADDPTKHIVTCWNHNNIDPDESEENARLIAAAPELLAACAEVKRWIGEDTLVDLDELSDDAKAILEMVRAVVAKATGDTP